MYPGWKESIDDQNTWLSPYFQHFIEFSLTVAVFNYNGTNSIQYKMNSFVIFVQATISGHGAARKDSSRKETSER